MSSHAHTGEIALSCLVERLLCKILIKKESRFRFTSKINAKQDTQFQALSIQIFKEYIIWKNLPFNAC